MFCDYHTPTIMYTISNYYELEVDLASTTLLKEQTIETMTCSISLNTLFESISIEYIISTSKYQNPNKLLHAFETQRS